MISLWAGGNKQFRSVITAKMQKFQSDSIKKQNQNA